MSEAAATVRAIDAISMTLAERMALVLRTFPDVSVDDPRQGERYMAYHKAGIDLNEFAPDEVKNADLCALNSELMRRMNP